MTVHAVVVLVTVRSAAVESCTMPSSVFVNEKVVVGLVPPPVSVPVKVPSFGQVV